MLLLSPAVFLAIIATVTSEKAFGCSFQKQNYGIDLKDSNNVYGDPVQPLEFGSDKELNIFFRDVEVIKKKVNVETTFNDLEYFLHLYQAYRSRNDQSKGLKQFFQEYAPDNANRSDSLGLILRVFKKMKQEMNYVHVEEHFYIAAAHLNVTPTQVELFSDKLPLTGTLPHEQFKAEHVVGVIKVKVKNNVGYIVLDLEYDTVVLLTDENQKTQKGEVKAFGKPIEYRLDGSFIHVRKNRFNPDTNRDEFTSVDQVFIEKPICNFVSAVNHTFLTKQIRTIAKISPIGTVEALVAAEIFRFDVARLNSWFLVGHDTMPNDRVHIVGRNTPEDPHNVPIGSIHDISIQVKEKLPEFPITTFESPEDEKFSFVAETFEETCKKLNLKSDHLKEQLRKIKAISIGYQDLFEAKHECTQPLQIWLEQYWKPRKIDVARARKRS